VKGVFSVFLEIIDNRLPFCARYVRLVPMPPIVPNDFGILFFRRPFLDSKTASLIATSIVHSKLDYCNSLYYNFPKSQLNRLQHIQNSLARAVVRARKFSHTTPILKSLHWLKINERIEYKILSLTFKLLRTIQLLYLYNLISLQPSRNTRSVVTLARPLTHYSFKITSRSFRYASLHLWNQLPHSIRQPRLDLSLPDSPYFRDHLTSSVSPSPFLSSITPSFFHSSLKTFLFLKSYPP